MEVQSLKNEEQVNNSSFKELGRIHIFKNSSIGISPIKLKLLSAIFHFFFTKLKLLNNYEKYFLFHLKSSFRSRDTRTFVFPSSHFFPLSAIA